MAMCPSLKVRRAVVYASCTKDGAALPNDLPAKLFELLASVAVPLNTLDLKEQQELFSLFSLATAPPIVDVAAALQR